MHTALIVCRLLHFWTVLMLFGLCFTRLLLGPALERALPGLQRLGWLRGLCAVALVSALAWLLLISASMAGSWVDGTDPRTLTLVLGSTVFGKVWTWHICVNALLLVMLLRRRPPSPGLHLALVFLLLATLAPVGHVAMFDGLYGTLMIANQVLHLSAVGAWLGGLGLLLGLLRQRAATHETRAILLRFSGLGYVMVALIIATGLTNVRAMSGALWPQPAFEGFGLILAVKLCMALGMLALALCNRLMLARKDWRPGVLRISILCESLFGVAALLAVSLLGTLPPMQAS